MNTIETNVCQIKNWERYIQSKLTDFSGLERRNKIRPTDIDGSYDIDEKFFCTLESKHACTELPTGQQRHFEAQMRMINAASKTDSRYFGVCLVYNHYEDCNETIKPENKEVQKIFDSVNLKWEIPEKKLTVIEAIDKYESIYDMMLISFNRRMAEVNADKARERYKQN